MFNSTQFPEDIPNLCENEFYELHNNIINMVSEKELSISQVRFLFISIMSQFERNMPVTNHKQ